MGLFTRAPKRPQPPARVNEFAASQPAAQSPRQPWSDGFGRLAIRAAQILLVGAVTVALIWGIQALTIVTIPLVIALILASAFAPAMGWMRGKGVPSLLATVISLLASAAILTGVGWLITSAVRGQWEDLSEQAQEGFQTLLAWIDTLPFAPTDTQIQSWIDTLIDFLTSAQFGSGAIAGVGAVASFVTGMVLTIVILFFFLKDGPQMWEFILRPFHGAAYQRAMRVGSKTVTSLGSYIRGTAMVALVDAVGILIGLLILQVPLALPLSVLVFLLAFIPIVGATLAGALAALVALVANGWVNALAVVGVIILVQQLEGNFLQPVLMGRQTKLNAFVILVALAAGTSIGGILGAVLAVPITAVAWGIIQVWDGPSTPARWARPKPARPGAS